ncbi:permease [Hoeflea sp. CAU 1731]
MNKQAEDTSQPPTPAENNADPPEDDGNKGKQGGLFDKMTIFFAALGLIAALALTTQRGSDVVVESLTDSVFLAIGLLPQIAVGLFLASLVSVMVPKDTVGKWLGQNSGLKGLIGATIIGAIMPGGPFASFPLALAFIAAGADIGCMIAFLLAWATIGLNRLLVWEAPFMGFDFSMLRFFCSLPAPIIAGFAARWLVRRFPSIRPDIG